jgi:mannose-6-phosphate isomerase-like protein (cupin superfamily)
MKKLAILAMMLMTAPCLCGAPREIAPTWLHRYIPKIPVKATDISTASCRYQPIFGEGDTEAQLPRSVARVGEVTIDPHGNCNAVSYAGEEQIYYILSGKGILSYGSEKTQVKQDDYMYLPPGIRHGLADDSGAPLKFVVMGFRIPAGTPIVAPPNLQIANSSDVNSSQTKGIRNRLSTVSCWGAAKATTTNWIAGLW